MGDDAEPTEPAAAPWPPGVGTFWDTGRPVMTPDSGAERPRPGSHRPQTHHDSAEVIAKRDALLDGNETQHSPESAMPLGYPNEHRGDHHFPRAHYEMWNDEASDSVLARVMRSQLPPQQTGRLRHSEATNHSYLHLTADQQAWANDRSLGLARTTARTFEHWFAELLRIADRDDREQITELAAASFSTVDALLQVIDYCDPTDLERLKRPTFNRATEQLTIALHALGRLLWARVERIAGPIVEWISLHIPTRRPTK